MRRDIPAITDAECQVIAVLWQHAPRSSDEIVAALGETTDWHEKTIRALSNRLLGKAAVRAARDGRRYRYRRWLTREQWQSSESRNLRDGVVGGKVAPLLAHFSTHE